MTELSDPRVPGGGAGKQVTLGGAETSSGESAGLVVQADIPAKAETWYVQIDGDVGANDNDLIYESGDISMYNTHVIENMSAGAGACDVHVSLDGTNYAGSAVSVELIDDVTTGGGIKVITIPQNKAGILIGKFNKIKVLQDGATAADARIAHSVS